MELDQMLVRAGDSMAEKGIIATIFGDAGVGKTTLAYKAFPDPLFIPLEDGMRAVPNATMLPKPADFEAFWEYLNTLDRACMEGKQQFKSVVIDSLTALDELVIASILAKHNVNTLSEVGSWGAGYTLLKKTMTGIRDKLNRLQSAGVHVALIAHANITKFSPPDSPNDYDRWTLALQKSTLAVFTQGVDAVMFIAPNILITTNDSGRGVAKRIGDERKIVMYPSPASIAKNRFSINEDIRFVLSDEINPLAFMFEEVQ